MDLNNENISNAILTELRKITQLMASKKAIWTMDEFCTYTGLSKEYAYQLTSAGKIKFYRPFGKMIFFDSEEVIEKLKQNPSSDLKALEAKSKKHLINNI